MTAANEISPFNDRVNSFDQIKDHYVEHLALLDESQDILSSEDIYNDKGVLVCMKGKHINQKMAKLLIQHKLSRPLEESISLTDCIDNQLLFSKLRDIFQAFPDTLLIHERLDFDLPVKNVFLTTILNTIVLQKLTVFSNLFPEQLEKAVFCAWLSLIITIEMNWNQSAQREAFLAGLLHDIGFLHLPPEILQKNHSFDAAQWRSMQSHVIIGNLMIEKYHDIPAAVGIAILEHHERCNGSGFPTNKNDTTLSVLGQIVGLADSIYSIRVKQFQKHGRNMYDLLPYLQMNTKTYFYDVYKTMVAILKRSGLAMTQPDSPDIKQWAENILLRSKALNYSINSLINGNVLKLTNELTGNKGRSMFKVTQHVLTMTTESGLVEQGMIQWLQRLIDTPDLGALHELNEIELMLNELHWQLNYAYRSCNSLINDTRATELTQFRLREAYNNVGLCLGDLEDKI